MRLLQRPDLALADVDDGDGALLALGGVGGQEVVERGRVLAAPGERDRLRPAAGEHVAAEAVAVDQSGRRLAHRFQPAQPEGKLGGQFLAGRLVAGDLRQQQLRFQVRQPCRHHEVVGGDFKAKVADVLDVGEVLLGQRQDRDAGEVDLLGAGKREQKVERPLEPVDVDHQRVVVSPARPIA